MEHDEHIEHESSSSSVKGGICTAEQWYRVPVLLERGGVLGVTDVTDGTKAQDGWMVDGLIMARIRGRDEVISSDRVRSE